MEAVLVTRDGRLSSDGRPTTSDLTLTIQLGRESKERSQTVTEVPETEWAGSSTAGSHPGVQQGNASSSRSSNRPHALARFSAFGSGETDEFATWVQGRETFLSSPQLQEECEDDMRSFAEGSDHTEGFMLSTSISDGFGGLTSSFLETLRDDFSKATIFTTATVDNASRWRRPDSERAQAQRTLNETLSMHQMEELSSMLMPVQSPRSWSDDEPWTRFLRRDFPRIDSYAYVLNAHLQSANSELREPDCLDSIVSQLNWRNDNKICHLVGTTPLFPPSQLNGEPGQKRLKQSRYDFSRWLPPKNAANGDAEKALRPKNAPERDEPFAMYSVVRGYGDEETQQLGPVLEKSTSLKEPLSTWVCLPDPYPHIASAPPVFRSLLPNGRPLILQPPLPMDPSRAPYGIFGAPDPLVLETQDNYIVQPQFFPLMTTLETTPEARHYLRHLSNKVKELLRVRSRVLWEYEEGEYGLGRDGIVEARETLESLADRYAAGGHDDYEENDMDEDEAWHEQEDELDRELME